MTYVVGLDGGGTKTAVSVYTEDGQCQHRFSAGTINYNGNSEQTVQKNLSAIFQTIDKTFYIKNCVAVCVGAAGISNSCAKKNLISTIRGFVGNGCLLKIVGDFAVALYGALGRPCGSILIAGTGSVCYGQNRKGESHRTGGFGHLLDDEGAGYALGRDILKSVLQQKDGRIPHTVLTEILQEKTQLATAEDIINFVYNPETSKKDIAALAPLLDIAYEMEDVQAQKIAEKAAYELSLLVVPVISKLNLENEPLALCGSILEKDPYIRSAFLAQIKDRIPEISCVKPHNSASDGAAMAALKMLK